MSHQKLQLDRRRFLIHGSAAVAVTTIAGSLGSTWAGCGNAVTAPPGPSNVGLTVADVAVGDAVAPAGANYILARDAQGFYAYSNLCTHQGCSLPKPDTTGASTCPCHQARFDANGDNLVGPHGGGTLPDLEHYAVNFIGTGPTAQIVVDTSMPVADRTARVPAP